jgi:hypothetical protein
MSLLHAPEWAQNWAYQCGVEEEEVESGPISRTTIPIFRPFPAKRDV